MVAVKKKNLGGGKLFEQLLQLFMTTVHSTPVSETEEYLDRNCDVQVSFEANAPVYVQLTMFYPPH